jgi:hypothetical protein
LYVVIFFCGDNNPTLTLDCVLLSGVCADTGQYSDDDDDDDDYDSFYDPNYDSQSEEGEGEGEGMDLDLQGAEQGGAERLH